MMDAAILIDSEIREELLEAGATIVGYVCLESFLHDDIAHLGMAIKE